MSARLLGRIFNDKLSSQKNDINLYSSTDYLSQPNLLADRSFLLTDQSFLLIESILPYIFLIYEIHTPSTLKSIIFLTCLISYYHSLWIVVTDGNQFATSAGIDMTKRN